MGFSGHAGRFLDGAGSITGKKEGFGKLVNLGIGMAGALIGGFLFNILKIDFGLADISISLHDLVAAFVGSLVFLGLLTYGRRWYSKKKPLK